MEAREKAESERYARIKQQEKEEDEKYELQVNELKGQEFTLDRSGSIIPILHIKPEKLPGPLTLGLAINEVEEVVPVKKGRKSSTQEKGRAQTADAAKGGGKKNKEKESPRDPFFRNADNHQPPLLTTIMLKAGVNLKEGEGQRAGPQRTEDSKHMSRKQFQTHQSFLDSQASAAGTNTLAAAESPKGGATSGKLTIEAPESVTPRASAKAPAASSPGRDEDAKDKNVLLTTAADWGANPSNGSYTPGYSPAVKPNEVSKHETFRSTVKLPRDRLHSASAASPVKHLPAPVFPQQFGHGMMSIPRSVSTLPLLRLPFIFICITLSHFLLHASASWVVQLTICHNHFFFSPPPACVQTA
jgi:hypothetical protein